MKIIQSVVAGTLESSDVLVRVSPASGIEIEINSSVFAQFGDDIYRTVVEVLEQLNVNDVKVVLEDKGALDCVLRARLKAALLRATKDEIDWEAVL